MTDTPQKSPGNRGLIGILICLVLGALVVLAGSDSGLRLDTGLGPLPLFVLCGMVGFVLHWLIFVPSFLGQTEHYFDLTGALSFIGTILLANWLAGATAGDDLRSLLLSGMVLAWSLRLGSFLVLRVKRAGQDRRFQELKTRFWRFLFTWAACGC